MNKIEIVGLEKLRNTINTVVPQEMRPVMLRDIARKPATRAASIARTLQPIGDSGATARTIGILKVKNPKWTFVEVGYRGRSLGHIYTSAQLIFRRLRGVIKGFPMIFKNAGERVKTSAKTEMKVDITKAFVQHFRRKGYRG